jgi:hypothetical protein
MATDALTDPGKMRENDERPVTATSAASTANQERAAQSGRAVPRDVRAFISSAEHCEHLAGEWDSSLSVARQEEIQRGVNKYCGLAQLQLKALSEKYKGDAATQDLIAAHANESVLSFEK